MFNFFFFFFFYEQSLGNAGKYEIITIRLRRNTVKPAVNSRTEPATLSLESEDCRTCLMTFWRQRLYPALTTALNEGWDTNNY